MKEIRTAIIGTGIIAHTHAGNYQKIPGVKIVAACDLQPEKLNKFCDQYSIEHRYEDYRELLKRDDIDAVDVCVHNNLHAPLSISVLRSGRHCYCEKPIAGSYRDGAAMIDAAGEAGKKLHIQLGFLYQPAAHAAKTMIDDGKLGRVYHARSYGFRRRGRPFVDGYAEKEYNSKLWAGGGALYDMGVYRISQLLYVMGQPKVERVAGQVYQEVAMHEGRRKEGGFDVEELGCGFVSFEGGLTMDIIESWAIHAGAFPASFVAGSKGGLSFGEQLKYYNEISGYPIESTVDVAAEQYRRRKIDPSTELFNSSQEHWIGVLRGECNQIDTPSLALQTMLISEGIYLSAELGREVTAEEIISKSISNAITRQETGFGVLEYKI
jgi:predicted dehydrogenase